jgi:hypothetical protein
MIVRQPFDVGKRYRNRAGEYIVQAIDGEQMIIRYVGGGTLETTVSIQARIWENIQFEEQMAREQERQQLARQARMAARKRTARARRQKARATFDGFQETDFVPKKRGISWSSRKELGGTLAYALSQRTGDAFDHWIVPRRSQIHVARKEHYDRDARDRTATFYVAVGEEGVDYGFRVGKPEGEVAVEWAWPAFVAALADHERVRAAVRSVMEEQGLTMDIYAMEVSYGRVGRITVQGDGFLWYHETADQEATRELDWDGVVEYLRSMSPDRRCDVFLRKNLPPQDALQAGKDASGEMAAVFEALLPLYDVTIGV